MEKNLPFFPHIKTLELSSTDCEVKVTSKSACVKFRLKHVDLCFCKYFRLL